MNIKSKKLLVVFAVVLITTVIAPIRSNAGLQANKGGTSLTYTTASQFFDGMRKMETKYGTLGKEAVLNDKYLDTTNNGIDVHMALNTEWGTVALLTDSAFGVGKGISGENNKTSTGNESGVYGLANGISEYTATFVINAGGINDDNRKIGNADNRYFNNYWGIDKKTGDAFECVRWLGGTYYNNNVNANNFVFKRNFGGIFGYDTDSGRIYSSFGSRAVVVCGENL